jgi:hypothetical protein
MRKEKAAFITWSLFVEVDSDQHEPVYVPVEDETALEQFWDDWSSQNQGDEETAI